jgi:hypothetical protein
MYCPIQIFDLGHMDSSNKEMYTRCTKQSKNLHLKSYLLSVSAAFSCSVTPLPSSQICKTIGFWPRNARMCCVHLFFFGPCTRKKRALRVPPRPLQLCCFTHSIQTVHKCLPARLITNRKIRKKAQFGKICKPIK